MSSFLKGPQVGVVGMGATGVGVFVELTRSLIANGQAAGATIHLFEPRDEIGAGVAYSTPEDCHLLNMRAVTMSLDPADPDDFVRWMQARPDRPDSDEYVPRRLFSVYLREHFDAAVAAARAARIKVEVHHSVVSDCWEGGGQVHLIAGVDRFALDYAVLGVGDLPSTDYLEFCKLPNYVHSPWQGSGLRDVPRDARVGIIGTSLTAVDVLLLLRKRGHRGPITAVARRRSLPKVQGPRMTHELRHVTRERLAELTCGWSRRLSLPQVAGLFRAELEDALGPLDWDAVFTEAQQPFHQALRHDVARAEQGETAWYYILDATSEIIPELWHWMTPLARAHFLEEHLSTWAMFRHCIPLLSGRRLLAMADAGGFEAFSGLQTVSHDPGREVFELAGSHGAGPYRHDVDYLINATGTGFALERSDSALLQNMLMRGDVRPHRLGGIDVDFDAMQVVRRDGSTAERTFFVGPLTRGVHFYTNSLETNLANSRRAATALTAHLQQV
ncbi:FAD/NAD(P)-binding protein [Actinoplanes sp. KI2]|uniref:FAD/NAD(P)-binding protein n=1 Tax=Actinoplanes sp. KI2 TaxID=2983315 RepID=UPI0021D56D11|nr:FAD/NAD(P)-binding protein [Actinoplanes sp. KI2]MCU7729692.1 FAD/NAD(P)-binding protein [Actinoplanes sp. KI2]